MTVSPDFLKPQGSGGAVMVEMLLVAVLVLMLIFAVLDFSLLTVGRLLVADALRETVRVAQVGGGNCAADINAAFAGAAVHQYPVVRDLTLKVRVRPAGRALCLQATYRIICFMCHFTLNWGTNSFIGQQGLAVALEPQHAQDCALSPHLITGTGNC